MAWKLTDWLAKRHAMGSPETQLAGCVPWTPEETETVVMLARAGLPDEDIAEYVSCSTEDVAEARATVDRWLARHRGAAILNKKMLPNLGTRRSNKKDTKR